MHGIARQVRHSCCSQHIEAQCLFAKMTSRDKIKRDKICKSPNVYLTLTHGHPCCVGDTHARPSLLCGETNVYLTLTHGHPCCVGRTQCLFDTHARPSLLCGEKQCLFDTHTRPSLLCGEKRTLTHGHPCCVGRSLRCIQGNSLCAAVMQHARFGPAPRYV
jgi:hypothetical protein